MSGYLCVVSLGLAYPLDRIVIDITAAPISFVLVTTSIFLRLNPIAGREDRVSGEMGSIL